MCIGRYRLAIVARVSPGQVAYGSDKALEIQADLGHQALVLPLAAAGLRAALRRRTKESKEKRPEPWAAT